MKVEVTLKLVIEFDDEKTPLNDPSLIDRIEEDFNLAIENEKFSEFQASDDEDYNFEYKKLKVTKIN
jgi:hypothetical protein